MTLSLLFLIVLGTAIAPLFTVVLCGLLVHHGLWSLEWAIPTLWACVALRYLAIESRNERRSLFRLTRRLAQALLLLALGIWAAHVFHHHLSVAGRYLLAALLLLLALVWLAHADRWLPSSVARVLARLPRPTSFPRGTRRVAAALVVMPFWEQRPVHLLEILEAKAEERGLQIDPAAIASGEFARPGFRSILGAQRVLLRAREPKAPNDIYLARVMFDHEGRPTRVTGWFNLTETAAADETDLVREGAWALWRVVALGEAQSAELADLRGEVFPSGPGWNFLGRLQRRITNLQETGQARGVGRVSVAFPKDESITTTLAAGVLVLRTAAGEARWEVGRDPGDELADRGFGLSVRPPARPGDLTTWAVDRLRLVVGSDSMQWIKGLAFWASSRLEDLHAEVVGVDAAETISQELGDVVERLPIAKAGPVPNWPPDPLTPLLKPPLPAEGQWVDLGRDPIAGVEGEAALLLTFIRVDPKRAYNQVSITLWDPRRIELSILAGTEEPKSTLGRQGTGLIPREPRVLLRLAGAFNGAFQAVHGGFGMMEAQNVQLPPKPWAATIATFKDGSVGMGTWPGEPVKIPDDMVGLRQNMTPLVAGGRANPYGRHWWGGVPEGWTEEARTVRSGLCLTQEGYLAYFYSPGVDPDRLAQAMLAARCQYGVHLDMNAGHVGLEFYRVGRSEELPKLGRELDPAWEATGAVPGAEEYSFLARLMVRKMPLMNFPRYIHQTPRDFFYLLRRDVLPGPALILPSALAVEPFAPVATTEDAFPAYVVAAQVRSVDDENVSVVVTRFDAKELSVTGAKEAEVLRLLPPSPPTAQVALPTPVGVRESGDQDTAEGPGAVLVLYHSAHGFAIRATGPSDAHEVPVLEQAAAGATYCVDERRFLNVVEASRQAKAEVLGQVLEALGCTETMVGPRGVFAVGPRSSGAEGGRPMFRRGTPWARQIFPQTPIVPQSVWGLPQARPATLVQ